MQTVHLPDGPFATAEEEERWQAGYDPQMGAIAISVAAKLEPRLKRTWAKLETGAGAYRMAKEAQLQYLDAKDTKYGKERARGQGGGRSRGRGRNRGRSRGRSRGK